MSDFYIPCLKTCSKLKTITALKLDYLYLLKMLQFNERLDEIVFIIKLS